MLEAASKITPGADGLLFLPYLFGERAPIYNEKARGVYFGLHNGHQREHFARAGLEGILYALYSIFEILQASQGKVQEIRATGGYVQSELMLQLQADIFGQPIHVPTEQEGSVIGAAALALLAMGKISNFDALEKFFKIKERYIPNKASHGIYQQNYTRFKTLYDLLKPIF
jgi:gluconokinase